MSDLNSILHHERPLKFLTAKILMRTGLCRFFTISLEHYMMKFYPTSLSRNKWINPNYIHVAEDPIFKDYMKNGDKVIDIGANIGTITLLAANLVGTTGKVYSIEPHPKIYKFLQNNIKLNNFTNVITFNVAIGNEKSRIGFSDIKSDDQNRIVKSDSTLTVDLVKLDDLPINEKIIDLLKIEAMGFEKFVLEGSDKILKKTKCIHLPIAGVYHKFFKLYGYHYNEILDILWGENFEIYEYDNKKNLYLVSADSNPAKGDLIAISDQEDFLLRTGYKINN